MMRIKILVLISSIIVSCTVKKHEDISTPLQSPLTGTWKLLKGTIIENGDTIVTDYTKDISFIKIINNTHFAFLKHDLNNGKDSVAVYVSGGGPYSLNDSLYTEQLEYCTAREWEGHDFSFIVTLKEDTLIQSGVEKVESAGVDRMNIEEYVRIKE